MTRYASRSYGLDFLKVLATLAVVLHHYQQVFEVQFENNMNFYGGWFYWGYMVELFFILSGYFMYRYTDRICRGEISLASWVSRRAGRLLPLMTVSAVVYEGFLFLYWMRNGTFFASAGTLSVWDVIITCLGLQEGGVFANPGINNPTWYISVLLICYVVFYLVTRLAAVLKCRPYYLYIAMVLLGLGILRTGISVPFLNSQAARGYRCFFYGLLLAQFVQCCGITRKEVLSCGLIAGGIMGMMLWKPWLLMDGLEHILCYLLFPSIIILLEFDGISRLFAPFWGLLGKISFNVYIWHLTVCIAVDLVRSMLGLRLDYGSIGVMLFLVGITVCVGALSYWFVEKPLDTFVSKQAAELCGRQSAGQRN